MKDKESSLFPNYTCTIVNGFTGGPIYRYLLDKRYIKKLHSMFSNIGYDKCPICGAAIYDDVYVYAVCHCECGTRMAVIKSVWSGQCSVAWFDIPVIGVDESDII